VLAEFCRDVPIYLVAVDAACRVSETSLAQLLPQRFSL
jgi:cytidine deaminase